MWFWLGLIDLVLLMIIIPMSLKQRRTLVPLFEDENRLCDLVDVPGVPKLGLGSLFRGAYYSITLAMFYFLSADRVEQVIARFPSSQPLLSKAEFMSHFSASHIQRAIVFTILCGSFLAIGMTGYFLLPPEAR